MAITLADLDALFSSLNDDEQLLLIDHLADRTRYGEELLFAGLQCAACGCAEDNNLTADDIIPQGSPSRETWLRYAEKRDATLEGAIRLRNLNRRAA